MNSARADLHKQETWLEMKVWAWITMIGILFILANIFSLQTEAARDGLPSLGLAPWITEFSSILATFSLFPVLAIWSRSVPISPTTWRKALFWHIIASVVFSFFHVSLMVGMRKLAFPFLLDRPYHFLGDFWRESFYEYRKDLGTYFLLVMTLYGSRTISLQVRELEMAKNDAKATGQITLKSGARMIRLDAKSFLYAEAAGNYVDVYLENRQILARSSLRALQQQLRAAGVPICQIHRTRLVNIRLISELVPAGSGDLTLILQDGTRLRASRRYRHDIKALISE